MAVVDMPRFHKPANAARMKLAPENAALEPSSAVPRLPLLRAASLAADAPPLQMHAQAGIEMQEQALRDESAREAQQTAQLAWLEDAKHALHKSLPYMGVRIKATDASTLARHPDVHPHVFRSRRAKHIRPDPDGDDAWRILQLDVATAEALSADARRAIADADAELVPHPVELTYDYWTVDQVLRAVLPAELEEGAPSAFAMVGHLAHLNLREEYLAYRYLIGQVVLEKTPRVRTVVNKLDSIETEFRVFAMELLAGVPEYEAEVSESNCVFQLDFRHVYWNSRLHTEHSRLIAQFKPFQVLADVMAGVGPFAVPAAKKGAWVLANDLNPSCYASLQQNSARNHVTKHLQATCLDGRAFIRQSVCTAWDAAFPGGALTDARGSVRQKRKEQREERRAREQRTAPPAPPEQAWPPRRLVDHFVMNLPATALEFLDAYRGLYTSLAKHAGEDALEKELAARKGHDDVEAWPMVHVHCFTKDVENPGPDICRRASTALGLPADQQLIPPGVPGKEPTPDLSLHLVRSVAPSKDMYCLSFRLSRGILFA